MRVRRGAGKPEFRKFLVPQGFFAKRPGATAAPPTDPTHRERSGFVGSGRRRQQEFSSRPRSRTMEIK